MIEFLYNVGTGTLDFLPGWACWMAGFIVSQGIRLAFNATPFTLTVVFGYVFIYHSKFLRDKKILTYSAFVMPIVFVLMFFAAAAHMKEQRPRSGYGYGKARFQSYDVLPSASRRS